MKTIEAASKDHSNNTWKESFVGEWDSNELKTFCEHDFKKGVEFAQRWIPVEESMPEILTDVLIKQSNGKIAIGCLMDEGFNVELFDFKTHVNYWRPIEL